MRISLRSEDILGQHTPYPRVRYSPSILPPKDCKNNNKITRRKGNMKTNLHLLRKQVCFMIFLSQNNRHTCCVYVIGSVGEHNKKKKL